MSQAHRGVTGVILDEDTGKPIASAKLKIVGREMSFNSSKLGEFWRLLLPGSYQLQVIEVKTYKYFRKCVNICTLLESYENIVPNSCEKLLNLIHIYTFYA